MDSLEGKRIKTEFGEATIKEFIRVFSCWKVEYEDGTYGWIKESSIKLIKNNS